MTSPQDQFSDPSSEPDLLPGTRRALLHRIARAQAEGRAPSLVASVVRGGRQVWSGARTSVDGHGPDDDVQYRVGSITKTFTAVLVMRLRDEGLLRLEDPVERHLPGTGVGEVTVVQLLSHTAGLAAETPGPWWERTPASLRPELRDVLGDRPFRHERGRRHHYSNPGFALLGALVARLRAATWEEVLQQEVLGPLGLHRTSVRPQAPNAGGWAVHPWADVLQPEKVEDLGVMAPAGQLWSTAGDLARFAAFLMNGDDRVLPQESVRDLRTAAAPSGWEESYGLGVQLRRRGDRTLAGHTGSVPGFVAGLWTCEEDDVAAVVLANCTSGVAAGTVAAELVGIVADAEPKLPAPWRPLPDVDQNLLALTGPWYWGTQAVAVRLAAEGGLELGGLGGGGRQSRFCPVGDGTWVGLDAYYAGEELRAVRDDSGQVTHLDLGSFVFTRQPYDEAAPVPGGSDPEGWRGLAI
ncbi:serine hydrolase domain-containing protein [Streptomyces sp. NPDC007088]|uniref:serine hydrolase domain-containing protein n=1 Tax=Streptomyces sp. NPDC007088 TaxID=3364773 RepID=UPI0036C6D6EC